MLLSEEAWKGSLGEAFSLLRQSRLIPPNNLGLPPSRLGKHYWTAVMKVSFKEK